MRYLLTLCFLLFFTFSHSQEYTKSFSVELDSIDNILASLPPCKDATIIESAIHRCDELDSLNFLQTMSILCCKRKANYWQCWVNMWKAFLLKKKAFLD